MLCFQSQKKKTNKQTKKKITIRPQKKKKKKNHEKYPFLKERKKPLFYGRMDLSSRVGRSGQFCFFLVAKKALLKKTIKFPKSPTFFGERFWKKIFSYFQNFLAKFSLTLTKNGCFYIVLTKNEKKKKKKDTKMEYLSRSRP